MKWRADFRGFTPPTLTLISDFEESRFHRALNTIDPPSHPCMPLWEDICQSCNIIFQSITLTLHGSHSFMMVKDVWMVFAACKDRKKRRRVKGKGGRRKAEKIAQKEQKKRVKKQSYESKVHWHGAASGMAHPSHHTHSCLTRSQSTIVMNWIWLISSPLQCLPYKLRPHTHNDTHTHIWPWATSIVQN